MADTKLSDLAAVGAGAAPTDEVYINDGGTSKKITVSNLMLSITNLTALAVSPAATDELLINDGGTIKKITADDLMFGDATTPSTQAHGDSAATGTAIESARVDHKHAMPAAGAPAAFTGAFTINMTTASGTQVVSGVGFTPVGVVLAACQSTAAGKASIGMDDGSNPVCNVDDHNASADTWDFSATASIRAVAATGTTYNGKVNAFNSDGFVIGWTRVSTPSGTLSVQFQAFG